MIGSSEERKLSVLVLEPYYGGSHKFFLDGLIAHMPFEYELITLPDRKWKWRMRLAAPYFAEKCHKMGKRFDRILCSTFIDVATFRGMAPNWVREIPLLTYFHENQFAYPVQIQDERDFHFGLTNMTTAIASDSLAFNSEYNLSSFLEGIEETIKHSYDMRLDDVLTKIRAKSKVIPLGIDFNEIDNAPDVPRNNTPVIIWNHRWEHDKNPGLFFKTLFELDSEGVDYRLIVLGESFKDSPEIFEQAKRKLKRKIIHSGYPASRKEYAGWLKHGDIIVSTSNHEFFGIAVLEAVRAGCHPLLPRRLSYPELYPGEYLYDDANFKKKLKDVITGYKRLSPKQSRELTECFTWKHLSRHYETWIRDARIK